MSFSFAELGFWRIAGLAFLFELLHALLITRWPELRGSRLGPRHRAAILFMALEAMLVMASIAAGIGTIGRTMRVQEHSRTSIAAVGIGCLCLTVLFFVVWQS